MVRYFADRPMMFLPNVDDSPTKTLLIERGEHRIPRPVELLYDLDADPYELNDLSGDSAHADVLAELRGRVQAWMEATDDPLLAGHVDPPEGAHVTGAGAVHPIEHDAGDDWRRNQ